MGPPPVSAPPVTAPPVAAPPVTAPPVDEPPAATAGLPFLDRPAGGRGAAERPAGREGGKRGQRSAPERGTASASASPRGSAKAGRGGSRKQPTATARTTTGYRSHGSANEADDASVAEELLEDERLAEGASLFRSSWFLPTLILLGVGGILAMWIVVRSGAFRSPPTPADALGDRDGLIEESVADSEGASGAAGASGGGDAGKKSGSGTSSSRRTNRSTIDNPFGAVELIQEGTGELHFTAQTAELAGGGLALEVRGGDSVVVGWANAEQTLVWSFRLAKPDIFRVELTYAAGEETRGAQFALQVDDEEPKANAVEPTSGPDKFRTDILHLPIRRSGKHQLRIAVQDLPPGGAIAVKSLRFVPKGLSDRKK
jgi:hypothetical protein